MAYNPSFEVEHPYAGFSVVARPGVGVDDESTTIDQVFKSPQDAQQWIEQHGRRWADEIVTLPGQSDVHHRPL